jgi:amidase
MLAGWASACTSAGPARTSAATADSTIVERSIPELQAAMTAGSTTSEALVRAYLARIAAMDRAGPGLRSVIAVNPQAIADAQAMDAERSAGHVRGPLHGVPVVIKDNIELAGPLPTTAGSLALAANVTNRDAPVVQRLKAAGAVIIAKTNLSEWANIRSTASMSGWSAVGGLVKNPYALDRTACGSSSGTGAAVAASFAAAGVGTETDGSVVCPSAMNGLVGLKPTMGLISRSGIVPISHSQDIPGPMGRTVTDVATLFIGMTGSDPADPATAQADRYRHEGAPALDAGALQGLRVAAVRPDHLPDALAARFDAALAILRAQGAVLVDAKAPDLKGLGEAEDRVLKTEFKADMATYLAETPPEVTSRTLADLIAFNKAHADQEMQFFGQDYFEAAENTRGLDDPDYRAALARSRRLAGPEGIDAILRQAGASVLVTPTYGMPWLSDPVYGDHFEGPSASELPAVSGYPHLTVPMGLAKGLPVGLSFIGTAHSDWALLNAGYAYEQAAQARVVPRYLPSADVAPGLDGTPAR